MAISETTLKRKILPLTIPYFLGMGGAYMFDLISKITGKKFSISSIRVKKFCATTQYSAEKVRITGFTPPFSLQKGLEITIQSILKD